MGTWPRILSMLMPLAAVVCAAIPVMAAPCLNGTLQDYLDLGSDGCTLGAYRFHSVGYAALESGGIALPDVAAIEVIPRVNDLALRPGVVVTGFDVLGLWSAQPNQNLTLTFDLSAEVLPGAREDFTFLLGYVGAYFPASFTEVAQWSLAFAAFNQDAIGQQRNLSELFSDFSCTECSGGGAAVALSNVLSADGTVTHAFDTGPEGSLAYRSTFLGVQTALAPEPTTLLLLGTGVIVLALVRRR